MNVHNHGPHEGRGLDCAEQMLGHCMFGELQASEAELVTGPLRDRLAKAEKDAAIYKDAFKDATMANTVAARKLAEQEAKTVEYRAAWIKATRERDEYRKLLREERDGRRILELEAGWVEVDR